MGFQRILQLAVFAAAVFGNVAQAHHSFASFDMTKAVTLKGTVHAWEWTNPHSWLWVDVADAQGNVVTWGLEGTAPGELTRQGWTKRSINPGDKVTVSIHPLKNGQHGGSFGKVSFEDGHTLGKDAAIASPPAGAAAPTDPTVGPSG